MRRREVRAGGHARWQGIWWARKWQGRAASCEVAESEGAGGCGEQGIGARLADGIPRQRAEGGHAKKCVRGGRLALRGAGRAETGEIAVWWRGVLEVAQKGESRMPSVEMGCF